MQVGLQIAGLSLVTIVAGFALGAAILWIYYVAKWAEYGMHGFALITRLV